MKVLNAGFLALLLEVCSISAISQGNISIDHYSGRAQVTIPLATVNDRGLSHTIGLMHNADAVKVDDIPGWVGTNWTLIAGGEVSRELHGLPDDFTTTDATDLRRGWLFTSNANTNNNAITIGNNPYPTDGSGAASCNPATLYDFINAFNHNVDTEPDEFHFNAGNISGTFVFDNTGSITGIKTIPYQDIKINAFRATATSPISSFEIVAPNGIKYVFSSQETAQKVAKQALNPDLLHLRKEYHWYKKPILFTSAWKLTSIESALGERIRFSYVGKEVVTSTPVSIGVNFNYDTYPAQINFPSHQEQYTIILTTTAQILAEITTPHQQIVLSHSSSIINPSTANGLVLKSITINEITSGTTIWLKTFILRQVGYQCSDIGDLSGDLNGDNFRRSFLTQIMVKTPCDYATAYTFTYNNVNSIPGPSSVAQDIWGYAYDITTNLHLFPKLYVYPSQTGIKRISLFQIKDSNGVPLPGEVIIPGADRIQLGTPLYGSLARVTYLSGGSDNIEYESHEFLNPITNTTAVGGGLRVKKITTADPVTNQNLIRSFQYLNSSGTTSGKLITLPAFWLLNGFYKEPVIQTNANEPIPNPIYSFEQLSSLSDYKKWNRLILRTKENINPDGNKVDSPIGYERVTEILSVGNGKTVYEFDIPYTYGSVADANWNPTYINVAASNACPAIGLNQPGFFNPHFVQQTPVNFRRGLLNKVSVYKEAENSPVKEILYTYQDKEIGQAEVKGLNYEFIPYSQSSYYFLLGTYKLKTNVIRLLTSKVERVRDDLTPSAYVETAVNYTYGADHNFITSTAITNSDLSKALSKVKYAKDFGTIGALTTDLQVNMIDALNTSGRIGEVIEQVNSIVTPTGTEKTIGGSLTLYDNFGTTSSPRILPKQSLVLDVGDGITGFTMSSFTGSGAGRTYAKSNDYRAASSLKFNINGDLIRQENNLRQFQSYHTEITTGATVASISNAEPDAVVYSNVDHTTNYGFDLFGFSPTETSSGKNATLGLGGVSTDALKYLKKQFKKKANAKYVFSAWYKPTATTGTHSLSITIKDLNNAIIQQHTLNYTISNGLQWYYGEKTIDLSSISASDVIIEVRFSGTAGLTSILDELLFAPEGTEVSRSSFSPYGPLTTTGSDGRMVQYEQDKSGRLRQVRDHENNIVQKIDYNRMDEQTTNFKIVAPEEIFINEPGTFKMLNGCKDVATIEWKVTPQSDPNGGVYATGNDEFTYTFPTGGNFIVISRVSHPSYGVYEILSPTTVQFRPLTVAICQEGPSNVNMCSETALNIHQCTGASTSQGDSFTTTFTATPSGCPGGTYTYKWIITRPGSMWGFPNAPATADSYTLEGLTKNWVTIENGQSYDVKCVVTSSCGPTGETVIKSVNVYSSPVDCTGIIR